MSVGKILRQAKERIRQLEQQNAQYIADKEYAERQYHRLLMVHSDTKQELLRHRHFLDIEVFKEVEPYGHVRAAITLDPRVASAINTDAVMRRVTELVLEVTNKRHL